MQYDGVRAKIHGEVWSWGGVKVAGYVQVPGKTSFHTSPHQKTPLPLPTTTTKTASTPGLQPCCRERWLALTLAHSVSLSGGQLMGERTSTAPKGVLLQWWRVQSAIQDAPGWGDRGGDGGLGTMAQVNQQGTALRTGATQNLALPRTPCGPSPGSWS